MNSQRAARAATGTAPDMNDPTQIRTTIPATPLDSVMPFAATPQDGSAATDAGQFAQVMQEIAQLQMLQAPAAAIVPPLVAGDVALTEDRPADDTMKPDDIVDAPVDTSFIASILGQLQAFTATTRTPLAQPQQGGLTTRPGDAGGLQFAAAASSALPTTAPHMPLPIDEAANGGAPWPPVQAGSAVSEGATVDIALPATQFAPAGSQNTNDADLSVVAAPDKNVRGPDVPSPVTPASVLPPPHTAGSNGNGVKSAKATGTDKAGTPSQERVDRPSHDGKNIAQNQILTLNTQQPDGSSGVAVEATSSLPPNADGALSRPGPGNNARSPLSLTVTHAGSLGATPEGGRDGELPMDTAQPLPAATTATVQARPASFTHLLEQNGANISGAMATPTPTIDSGTTQAIVDINPRFGSAEWRPAFTSNVQMLVNNGITQAALQLHPADLGPIEVRIQMVEQRADISFTVANADAGTAIQSALPDLREQLQRGGIQLGQTSVGGNGSQSQDARQPFTPAHQAAMQPYVRNAEISTANQPLPLATARSANQIDFYA